MSFMGIRVSFTEKGALRIPVPSNTLADGDCGLSSLEASAGSTSPRFPEFGE